MAEKAHTFIYKRDDGEGTNLLCTKSDTLVTACPVEPLDRLLEKKRRKIWRVCNKVLLLHPYSRAMLPGTLHFLCLIGVWCNGNTADSGPAFPGSSPGTPTNLFSSLLPG